MAGVAGGAGTVDPPAPLKAPACTRRPWSSFGPEDPHDDTGLACWWGEDASPQTANAQQGFTCPSGTAAAAAGSPLGGPQELWRLRPLPINLAYAPVLLVVPGLNRPVPAPSGHSARRCSAPCNSPRWRRSGPSPSGRPRPLGTPGCRTREAWPVRTVVLRGAQEVVPTVLWRNGPPVPINSLENTISAKRGKTDFACCRTLSRRFRMACDRIVICGPGSTLVEEMAARSAGLSSRKVGRQRPRIGGSIGAERQKRRYNCVINVSVRVCPWQPCWTGGEPCPLRSVPTSNASRVGAGDH